MSQSIAGQPENTLAHQAIKEPLDGGQVLLDRLRRTGMFFDVGRDVQSA
jgi:hypothetical protein